MYFDLEDEFIQPTLKIEVSVSDYLGVLRHNFDHIDELFYDKELPLDYIGHDVEAAGGNLNHLGMYPNLGLILTDVTGQKSALALIKKNKIVSIGKQYRPCGIEPKNVEQKLALAMLSDESIPLVTITGESGSGKTFLAIAHAMQQLKSGRVKKIVIAKSLVPVGREVGFLKGDLADKVRPWLGNFYDNLEALGIGPHEFDDYLTESSKDGGRIEISPITFIQGRSIADAVVIVDEAQNLSREVIHQIITRPAQGTKLVLLGDTRQVFERGINSLNNGLSWVVEKGKESDLVAHIHLPQVERSKLAAWASKLNPNES
jgi:PhoH-like ATPase